MKAKLILNISLVSLAFYLLGCSGVQKTDADATVSLFDGKSLAGWEGDLNWFRVEDGSIVAGSLQRDIPQNKILCKTKEYRDIEFLKQNLIFDPNKKALIQQPCYLPILFLEYQCLTST